MKYISLIVLSICTVISASAQSFSKQSIEGDNVTLNYWLYTPKDVKSNLPLLIYLHGGSGKGSDLEQLFENSGFPQFLQDGELGDLDAYVIIPQLPSNIQGWANVASTIRQMVVADAEKYGIDKSNISLTGHSMGGTGTWSIAIRYPKLFSRVAPLSGSVSLTDDNLRALSNLPVWAIVGADDDIVPPDSSEDFINALSELNNQAKITVIPGYGHFDVPNVYIDEDLGLIDWLLNTSSAGIESISSDNFSDDNLFYDLQGRKVDSPRAGFFIHNRKVVLLK